MAPLDRDRTHLHIPGLGHTYIVHREKTLAGLIRRRVIDFYAICPSDLRLRGFSIDYRYKRVGNDNDDGPRSTKTFSSVLVTVDDNPRTGRIYDTIEGL